MNLDDATALVRDHRVVVDATGSARVSSLLASAAEQVGQQTKHTVVSVCVQRGGDVLRVDRLPLRRGEVYLPALAASDDSIGRQERGVRERGCGSPVSPSPPGAVVAAAELVVRVLIDELTFECAQPATIVDVRRPQPEQPYHRVGLVTSAHVSDEASVS